MIPGGGKGGLTENVRTQLAAYCRNKGMRIARHSPAAPIKWKLNEVIDPETGVGFTESKAWQFIADLLEAGHPVEVIELRKPPGKKGYVLLKEMEDGKILYIKLQLGNKVLGRSFHYSDWC